MKGIIIGSVMVFVGIWGGSLAFEYYENCWQQFPSFVTSMIMVLLGGITATTCFINYPPEGKGDGKKQDKGDDE